MASSERLVAKELGLEHYSWSVNFFSSTYQFESDWSAKYYNNKALRILRRLQLIGFGIYALFTYDAFHFYGGLTFLNLPGNLLSGLSVCDLRLLKRCGKRLFMTFQGSDARLAGSDPTRFPWVNEQDDAFRRIMIDKVVNACDRTFCLNPDLIPNVPGAEFVPYASVNPQNVTFRIRKAEETIKILHAPTNRLIKGTDHVIKAVEELKQEYPIELILVEGLTHHEALSIYDSGNIVIDQLLVGWYGGFAVEAMAMGLPVIAFIDENHLQYVPTELAAELPIIRAVPNNLIDVLGELVASPSKMEKIGARSRAYVERWHDPAKIAAAMLKVYENPATSFWEVFTV